MSPLAKITRPKLSGIAPRERLFLHLDAARTQSVIWIGAPAGSGKTTLVASWLDARRLPCLWYQIDAGDADLAGFFYYMGLAARQAAPRFRAPLPLLTPECQPGLAVFTRRYFEALFARLKPPAVLVLDNYQDAEPAPGFNEMMLAALEAVPAGITVVVLSRSAPPAPLARLQANNGMHVFDRNDVRFSRTEADALLQAQGHGGHDLATLAALHERTEGWAAGLVLMARAGKAASAAMGGGSATPGRIFDYFASEIFDRTDATTQDLLLRTACLQRVDAALAEVLTGHAQAARILDRLCRQHYFTQKYDRAYQYHPLFREFLLDRAAHTLPAPELAANRRAAADLLEAAGQVDEAIGLALEAGDFAAAERRALLLAPMLHAQGRSRTLDGWLARLPPGRANASPWVLYWLGTGRVPVAPPDGYARLDRAFRLFQAQGDRDGALRAWASMVMAVTYAWNDYSVFDSLIDWYYAQDDGRPFASPAQEAEVAAGMTMALFLRRPEHPDRRGWIARALAAARRAGIPELRQLAATHAMVCQLWAGDYADLLAVADEVRDLALQPALPPMARITRAWLEGNIEHFIHANHTAGRARFVEALRIADEFDVHAFDNMLYGLGIYGALLARDRAAAEHCLARMKATLAPELRHAHAQYYYLAAWYHLTWGDLASARAHAELAVRLANEVLDDGIYMPEPLCRIGLANVLVDVGDLDAAAAQLDIAQDQAARTGSMILTFSALLARARVALARDQEPAALEALRQALALGRARSFRVTLWWWQPDALAKLFLHALSAGIEVDYVRALVRRHGFLPDPDRPCPNWPWAVEIDTLGRFEVRRDGQPLQFGGKVQKKPLELLKALIAFGGRDVSAERLSASLWPEAEGDNAHRSFETALHRLRKLVGEGALILSNGLLTLNAQDCRVDAWEFSQQARKSLQLIESVFSPAAESPETLPEALRAVELYRGKFLPDDVACPWSSTFRERLKDDFTALVCALGGWFGRRGNWQRAADVYRRGLEADDLAEELYRRLMQAYFELGQAPQVDATFRTCCRVLGEALGLSPSARTEQLYATLLAGKDR